MSKRKFEGSPESWRSAFQRIMNATADRYYQSFFGWVELTAWAEYLGLCPIDYDGGIFFDVLAPGAQMPDVGDL